MLDLYKPVGVFILVSFVLGGTLLFLPFLLSKLHPSRAKLAPYECGVEPIGSARMKFDIRFFLVAIMFIVFDIEIMLLLPWAVTIDVNNISSFIYTMIFISALGAGLIYEWKKGAMDL